jgi:hypothetical protein
LLGFAAWVGILAAALAVNDLLTEKETYRWHYESAPVDIVGIANYAANLQNDDLLRDTRGVPWVHPDDILVRVRKLYTPKMSFLDITQGPSTLIEVPSTQAQRDALTAAWKTLVREYPGAFLHHRISRFLAEIKVTTGGGNGAWTKFTNTKWADDVLHHRASHGWIQKHWVDGTVAYDRWFGGRVRLYLLIALALLPMCRRDRLALALVASGIVYELGIFLAAPTYEYRSSHWMVIATMVGAIMLFVTRIRPATPSPGLALQEDLR